MERINRDASRLVAKLGFDGVREKSYLSLFSYL